MFTLVFIFCIRFLIRFSSRSHRLTIWDMMVWPCVCVFWFVCGAVERKREQVDKKGGGWWLAAGCGLSEWESNGGVTRLFFANECDLDLSSWFIILRCLRSCCFCCSFCCCCCLYVVLYFAQLLLFVRVGVRFCVDLLLPLVVLLCGFLLFRLNSFDSSPRLSLQNYKAKMLHRIYVWRLLND